MNPVGLREKDKQGNGREHEVESDYHCGPIKGIGRNEGEGWIW